MTDTVTSPESTAETPAKGAKTETRVVTEGTLKRYLSGPGQFVLAIGACLALVLAVFLITPSEEEPSLPRTIDYSWNAKEFARKAPYETFAPTGLPTSWAATGTRLTGTNATKKQAAEHTVAWHLALITPSGRYAAFEQSNERPDGAGGFVSRMTNVPKSKLEDIDGTQTVNGIAWDRYYQRDKKQYSLVRRLPDSTVVLTGTAGYDELAVLAASLAVQSKTG